MTRPTENIQNDINSEENNPPSNIVLNRDNSISFTTNDIQDITEENVNNNSENNPPPDDILIATRNASRFTRNALFNSTAINEELVVINNTEINEEDFVVNSDEEEDENDNRTFLLNF